MPLKLVDDFRVVFQPPRLQAMQEQHGVAMLRGGRRLEEMALVASDLDGCPLLRVVLHGLDF